MSIASEIERILAENPTFHDEEAPQPSEQDIDDLGKRVGNLPESYRQFVLQGGLRDLRFSNRVLEHYPINHPSDYLPEFLFRKPR